jgi:phosphatidylserine decarboxylase
MSKQLSTFYQIKIPIMMRRYLYGRYIKKYGINVD